MGEPIYYSEDLFYLIGRGSYLRLAKLRSAMFFLAHHLDAGRECIDTLRAYPKLRIEALEFHYACLLSLGALDDALLGDLVEHCNWRGVVWGAWLAVLEPRSSFIAPLEVAKFRVTHNRWLVEAALAVVRGLPPAPELREFVELAEAFRAVLEVAERPRVRLRRTPGPSEQRQLEGERERVALAYRAGGAEAARAALAGTLLEVYLMPYPQWVQRTR